MQSTGSHPCTSSVAQAITNSPQSDEFDCLCMFMRSNRYVLHLGRTNEHICFLVLRLTDPKPRLSYMPTECNKLLPSLMVMLEARIQWQPLTLSIWMKVECGGRGANICLRLEHCVLRHPKIFPSLCLQSRVSAALIMLSLSHKSEDSRHFLSIL